MYYRPSKLPMMLTTAMYAFARDFTKQLLIHPAPPCGGAGNKQTARDGHDAFDYFQVM